MRFGSGEEPSADGASPISGSRVIRQTLRGPNVAALLAGQQSGALLSRLAQAKSAYRSRDFDIGDAMSNEIRTDMVTATRDVALVQNELAVRYLDEGRRRIR